jgi:hypothetical protein
MMNVKTTIAATLLLAGLALPSAAGQLTAAELQKLAPGNYDVNVMGFIHMTIAMSPGGSISGITSKKKRDTGIWSVQGEKLCIRWNRWLKGKTRCVGLSGSGGSYSGGGIWLRKSKP